MCVIVCVQAYVWLLASKIINPSSLSAPKNQVCSKRAAKSSRISGS